MPRAVGRNRTKHFFQSCPFLCPGGAGFGAVLRGAAAPLSAAARGVSNTLPSSRAKCSLRGALRGGSAASGSACIGRRAGQNRGERRPAALGRGEARFSPRSAHQNGHFPSSWKMSGMPRAVGRNRAKLFRKAGRLFVRAALRGGGVLRGAAASLSAAARGVSDTLPSNRAKCSLRGALRGGSAASGPAGIGRRAGKSRAERRPALPRRPPRPVFSPAFPRPAPAPPCCPLRPPLHAVSKK